MQASGVRVLLAEDNPADVLLLKEAFREIDFRCEMIIAGDGDQALGLLTDEHGAREFVADLIILDLNLPKISGLAVLSHVRSHPRLSPIPVVLLSTSRAAADIDKAIALGANRYISKAYDFEGTVTVARDIEDFWRNVSVTDRAE
jgi:two-component system response regulator